MAKHKKDENPSTISSVEETLTRTEQYLEENYKTLLIGLAAIVLLVGLGWLAKIYLNKRNDEAQSQMFQAEKYLEIDSLKLALNGDGN
jgi:anaerobic C4-dicarboxylate transporter